MEKINHKNRIQQRQITVTEFSDGTFELDGIAWKLEVDKIEVDEAFKSWRVGLLRETSNFDNRLPRMLKKINDDKAN